MDIGEIVSAVVKEGWPGIVAAILLWLLWDSRSTIKEQAKTILDLHTAFQTRIDAVQELRLKDLQAIQSLATERVKADITLAGALEGMRASVDRTSVVIDRLLTTKGGG